MKHQWSFLIACIIALAFMSCQQQKITTKQLKINNIGIDTLASNLTWDVKGCASKSTGRDAKSIPGNIQEKPPFPVENSITFGGDSVVYQRQVDHLCCRLVEISTKQQNNVISIIEFWHKRGCKCHCTSNVRAVIHNLKKGTYQVLGIETGTNPFDDKPYAGADTVLRQIVTIR